jgi:hypothetical protein
MSPRCEDSAGQGADGRARPVDHAGELIQAGITRRLSADQERIVARRLAIFERACRDMAASVNIGAVPFIDAVDSLYTAALDIGLVAVAGDDRIQRIMHEAFKDRRRP